ncbi:MAG: hypothetical protein AAGJ18_23055 [Bacteroidota bacterium]
MMRICLVLFMVMMVIFSACQEAVTPTQSLEKQTNIFFDLKGFFEKEKALLAKVDLFIKTVSINGASENKSVKSLNLDNELSIFMASDINRPAWSDKYQVDSTFNTDDRLLSIVYTALDEQLKIKKLTINFDNQKPTKIAIEKATDNPVAQSKQFLNYTVGKGYSIQSEQTLSLSDTKTIIVSVEY